MLRSQDAAEVGPLGDAGELIDFSPLAPAIFRHLNQAVISSHVQKSLVLRRLRQCDNVTVKRSRHALGNRVGRPDLPHYRQLVAIELPRQIRTDGPPIVAPVVTPKELVGSKI